MSIIFIHFLIITIFVMEFIFERYLEFLNNKKITYEIPFLLKDVFEAEKYKKQQEYKKENSNFNFYSSSISFLFIFIILCFGLLGYLDEKLTPITSNPILKAILFFGVIALINSLISIPFDLYNTFVIESKYGFNKTNKKTYILDLLKSTALFSFIGGGILSLIILFYQYTGNLFWVYSWILISSISIFMAMFYSVLIVPMFNKQTPLASGLLRDAIEKYCQKVGYVLKDIYVIDGSKRSTKANAYFTGFGKTKRIVLYDTLIKDLETEEIVAVLAHEIGHYKKNHVMQGLIFGLLQTGFLLYILSLFISIPALSQALGAKTASFHVSLLVFSFLFTPASFILGIIGNVISRKNEYQADAYAKNTYDAKYLISGLKKLTSNNLGNLTPHPTYVYFHYSHPTLLQRINSLLKN